MCDTMYSSCYIMSHYVQFCQPDMTKECLFFLKAKMSWGYSLDHILVTWIAYVNVDLHLQQ